MPPFHARDRTFLAFSYVILIKQIFHMLTDSALQLLCGYRFPNCFAFACQCFRVFSIGPLHSWSLILYRISSDPLKSELRSEIDSTRAIPPEKPKLSTRPMGTVTPTVQPSSTAKPTKGILT